jgi:D-alanyl-D-alanine carboxypeptidase/D-alanyl-D-alanine-endopeptidase (penicillin-binding protein 4)
MSRGDTVTARGMATLCQKLQNEPWFSQWQGSLPVLGASGDLRDRSKQSVIKGRVRGKSGLITRVRGLCGYLDAKSGRKLTFAVHVNGYENSWNLVDADIDALLMAVYEKY